MVKNTKNQIHHVSNNKELRKIIFKTKGATIILFKDIDVVNASIRIKVLKRLYSDWRGDFIMIR